MKICRDLDLLYPKFREMVETAISKAQGDGLEVYIFETYRTPARQNELYLAGKASPLTAPTKRKGWRSWHQFGLAADIAFGGPGKWHWMGDFKRAGAYFLTQGLRSGGASDLAHYEWPAVMTIDMASKIEDEEGVLGVWQKL